MTWTFNKVMLKLHLWIGLAAAVFLLIVGGTGTILEFEGLTGNRVHSQPHHAQGPNLPTPQLLAAVHQAYPGSRIMNIGLAATPGSLFTATLVPTGGKPRPQRVCVDPDAGVVIPCPEIAARKFTAGDRFMGYALQLHKNLMLGRKGTVFVAWITVTSVFMALTGLILWWPHQIWWFIKGASWRRFNFDLHSIAGLYSAVFFFVIALTGVMMYWGQVSRFLEKVTGEARIFPGRLHSTPPSPGALPLSLEELVTLADTKIPGTQTLNIGFGLRPTDPVNVMRTYSSTPGGKSRVFGYLDQYTGAVLGVDDWTKSSWVVTMEHNVVSVHEGSYWGIVGRVLFGTASTALPVMSITGFIIWWKRKQTEWQRRKRKASGLPLTSKELEDLAEEEREDMVQSSSPAVIS